MPSSVAALLRERTAATHERVEQGLGLRDGRVTADRLGAIIERFAGFWPAAEDGVDAWALANPVPAAELSWPRRRRSHLLRADLLALGRTERDLAALPGAPALFGTATPADADVLGWLYVAEGSTLGGAVIDRALRRHGDHPGVRTFTPYDEGPGPMWLAYQSFLAGWAGGDPARAEAVATSAQRCFAALADWLEPLGSAEAAA